MAYNSTRETELLGMHLKNPSGTPAKYSTSQPALMGRNVLPLYPERYSAEAAVPQPAPLEQVNVGVATPAVAADVNAPVGQPETLKLAALPDDAGDNGSIQTATNTAPSPLAIPVREMRLPPPPSSEAIRAYNAKQPAAAVSEATPALPENDLQPIARPAPAAAANTDVIEPGVSYAPDPASASQTVSDAPAVIGQPVANTTTANGPHLSADSKRILGTFPRQVGQIPVQNGKYKVDRVSPAITKIVEPNKVEASYEAAGIKIEVSRAGLDTNYELNRAYDALMAGNAEESVRIYRDILSVEPQNEEALFGLAATFHRLGATDKARPLYVKLLQVNPTHREALNNYLSIAGDEAPEEALLELEQLRLRNPNFSPIPAQMGLLYGKTGQFEQARTFMLTAIHLAPENLVYQYNLAVLLDQHGDYADASALYGALLKASQNGGSLPVDIGQIQKRYNFLSENITRNMRVSSAQ